MMTVSRAVSTRSQALHRNVRSIKLPPTFSSSSPQPSFSSARSFSTTSSSSTPKSPSETSSSSTGASTSPGGGTISPYTQTIEINSPLQLVIPTQHQTKFLSSPSPTPTTLPLMIVYRTCLLVLLSSLTALPFPLCRSITLIHLHLIQMLTRNQSSTSCRACLIQPL